MLSVRKQDPLFINFVPKTAEEAVDRYIRCKRRGLKPYLIPECLISCAQGLDTTQLEKFENWIVNPEGNTDDKMDLVETARLQADNAAIFEANAHRVERLLSSEIPPLPLPSLSERALQEDEKCPMEEKLQEEEKCPMELASPSKMVHLEGGNALREDVEDALLLSDR